MTEEPRPWTAEEQKEDGVYFKAIAAFDLLTPLRILIASHHLEDALPHRLRRKLAANIAHVVLVDAPTEAWSAALSEAAGRLYPGSRVLTGTHQLRRKPDLTLAPARCATFAISENRATLPAAAVAGADVAIRIWPSPKSIERTLRVVYGRSARVARADISGLNLPDLEFSLRPSGTAAAAVARMRRAAQSRSKVEFDVATPMLSDLAGYGGAMDVVLDIAREVAAAKQRSGLRLPSMLLHGRPGAGKTLLVRSFARTVGLPLVLTSISEWFRNDGHLGDVIKSARAAFDQALSAAPAILFIDEIDGLPDREAMDARGRDWWTPVVTSILLSIDRVREAGAGVILIGATNHIAHLDRALIRPGRFDRLIEIAGPQTAEDIVRVFRTCLGDDAQDLDLTAVARLAREPTGAAIVGWVAQARAAAKAQDRRLALKDLVDAVAPPDARDPAALRATALHESAHAIVGAALGLEIRMVSIIGHDQANGVTTIAPPNVVNRERLEAHIITTLAGRAADIRFSGAATSGSAADLAQATRYVSLALCVFGLGDELVSRTTPNDATTLVAYDLLLRGQVEKELQRLMARAQELVEANAKAIERLADRLLSRRVVTGAEAHEALRMAAGSIASAAPTAL